MPDDFVLSVDIGTSATKAVLFDTDAHQVALVRKHYQILVPASGWSEQEPETIFRAVLEALREIVGLLPAVGRIRGVVFSSQLYSLLAVDTEGKPLTNSLTWSDTRSVEVARSISRHPAASGIYQRTGCPIDAIYPLSKIGWLKENLRLAENTQFISIKEYVIAKLTGCRLADWSIASATGLFDIKDHRWDEEALSLVAITPDNLSELVSPRHIISEWSQEIADQIGIPADIPLIIGGGDGPLASLGVGGFQPDRLAVNVGTSAAARSVIPDPQVDPEGRLWTYVVDEDLWVIGGIVSSGGIVYDWALRNFFSGAEDEDDDSTQHIHEYVDQLASAVPPGAENLIFIPYLGGEQCPVWRPHTRGSFFGLDFRHNRSHLFRAVLEGITRSIYRVSESIQALLRVQFNEIRVTGGLTSSPVWLQIAADMFGAPIAVPESAEGSARGAAMLGLIVLGLRSGIEDFRDVGVAHQRVHPRQAAHAYYQRQYRTFQRVLDLSRGLQESEEVPI
jgi:gluconokinase